MEIWRDIQGYEGLYQVSNEGRVRSLGNYKTKKEKILRTRCRDRYMYIGLHKDGKEKKFLVHRLVAEAFIPNPNNLLEVNHKDLNPSNNKVENLEWCTAKYNSNYGSRNTKISNAIIKSKYFKLVSACCRGLLK